MTGHKKISLNRPPVLATLLTFLGVAILCGLGTWQLQRLEWKTNALNTLAQENKKDPAQTPLTKKDLLDPDIFYIRGSLTGYFDHSKELFLAPRTYERKIGFHVITPFVLEDGTQVLVNRGWHEGKDKAEHLLHLFKHTITGMAAKPPRRNIFTPQNNPDKNQWYWLDFDEISRSKGLEKLAPIMFYQEYTVSSSTLLKPLSPGPLNNNHLQYALFWFTMAGALLVVFVLRFVLPNKIRHV